MPWGVLGRETAPSTDAAKQWAGWGTALKPAQEPILLCRKPLEGTVAANVLAWGTGGVNVDGCRVERPGSPGVGGTYGDFEGGGARESAGGRWPPNVLLTHGPECGSECGDGCPVETLGDPAEFFPSFRYQSKASRKEREAGLIAPEGQRANTHPTVKPIALMRWLVRLVTPPGGVVLDPFCGSGSTGCAAAQEGFQFKGIERDLEYALLAMQRIDAAWENDD